MSISVGHVAIPGQISCLKLCQGPHPSDLWTTNAGEGEFVGGKMGERPGPRNREGLPMDEPRDEPMDMRYIRERMGNKNSGILMGFAIDTKKKSFLIYNDWRRFTPGPTFRTFRNHRRGAASNMSQVGGLARDVLTQRGGHVVAPVEGDTGPPPPPRPVQSAVLWQPPQARLQSHAKSSQG